MESYVQKWGNSLWVRIPKKLAKQLHLYPGTQVKLEVQDGKIAIQVHSYDLETMIAKITPKNAHHLLLEDEQKGDDVW